MDLTANAGKLKLRMNISGCSKCKVFEPVLIADLPQGTKIIDSVWAMKKKSNGTLCGRINARGFKQVEGQHYDGTTISSPVTNAVTTY